MPDRTGEKSASWSLGVDAPGDAGWVAMERQRMPLENKKF